MVIKLISSLAVALLGGIFVKHFCNRYSKRLSDDFLYTATLGIVAAVTLLCLGGFGHASSFTVILGVIFGAVTALQSVTYVAAFHCGPMSYTSVIISFSTIMSALSGVLFFDEELGISQIVGIALMLASFVLAAKSDNGEKKANLKWLGLCLISFLGCGSIGIMQKIHQSSDFKDELSAFLIIAFATLSLLCYLIVLVLRRLEKARGGYKQEKERDGRETLRVILIMVAAGICTALNNKFNLYLSGVIPSAIFFPIVNGGGLVLTTIAALVIFKERLTLKQWIGIGIGIVSVVLLCNPFGI